MIRVQPILNNNIPVIYIRVDEGCNLYCKHCFIPKNPKKIDLGEMSSIGEGINEKLQGNEQARIQWHGGEPTLRGPEYLDAAISEVNSKISGVDIIHSMQTNLMSYNEKWKQVIKEHMGSTLGVSWDYGIRLVKEGDDFSNEKYEEIFWDKVHKVISDGIHIELVITVTKPLITEFSNASKLLAFLRGHGIKQVHFERLTKTGNANKHWNEVGITNSDYSRFMQKLSLAWATDTRSHMPSQQMFVSPVEGRLSSVASMEVGKPTGVGCFSGSCDTGFHTFDADGYKTGCTALTTPGETGITKISLNDISIINYQKIRDQRVVSCHNCKFKSICSSGCLEVEHNDGSGECSGAYGFFNTLDRIYHSNLEIYGDRDG